MSSVRNLAIAMGAMLVLVMVFVSPAAAQTYAVTFTESGLPAGTQWTVALTGVGTMSSTTITITFPAVSPGTYPYAIANATTAVCQTLCTFYPVPATGSVVVVSTAVGVSATFTQRFFLTVSGGSGGGGQGWYNVGSTATASSLGVFGRASGTGFRVASYAVDGGSNTIVSTVSTVTVSVTMDAAHSVAFNRVTQYQVSLDTGATSALASISAPTLEGDNYWYDAGTAVTLVLNGAWGRSSGTGFRLVSYTLNGGTSVPVAATGPVTVFSLASIASPQTVTAVTTTQYQLTLDNGAAGALSSLPATPIAGDNYWYDVGTMVQYVGQAVFGRSAGAGMRVSGWWLDSNSPNSLATAGTFTASVTMSAPHSIHTTTVPQYQVSISGNYSIASISQPTVGGDNYWYDTGTPVSVRLNGTFSRSAGTGERMTGYSLNGGATIPVATTGSVTILYLTAIGSPQTIAVASATQFQVSLDASSAAALNSITPPAIRGDNYWYDGGTSVTLELNGVWGRIAGSGYRLASYSLDGGSPVTVATNATVAVLAKMPIGSPQTVTATDLTQYQLTVNGGSGISYSVGPQIIGDVGWYDSGTSLQVVSAGVYGRSSGVGQRVIFWSKDGGSATPVSGAGAVRTSIITMNSPHTVSFGSVTQYQVSLSQGATTALRLISFPTILNDDYWYDAGSTVTLVLNGAGTVGQGTRYHLTGYSVDGGIMVPVTGTAPVAVFNLLSLVSPQSVAANVTTQYQLTVNGGDGVTVSEVSPTGDGWYNNGTSLTVSSSYLWAVIEGQSRQSLTSYTLDNTSVPVSEASAGVFVTPAVVMDEPHSIQFVSITQYYLSLVFTDSKGDPITPSNLQMLVAGLGSVSGQNGSSWVDSGSSVTVTSVLWHGVDVKPSGTLTYVVNGPMTESIAVRVYEATLTVVDEFGIPVAGATARVTFANGTILSLKSGSSGAVQLGLIPIGTYHANVSNLGFSTSIDGDASSQAQVQARVPMSIALILVVILVAFVVVAVGLLYRQRLIRAT